MRVAELRVYHVRVPLKHTVRHASFARDCSDNFVVCCRLDSGTGGWGEGLPRAYVTGETVETCWQLLDDADLPALLGEPFADLADAVRMADRLDVAPNARSRRSGFGNALRCAIELSLLDAAAREHGQPLSAVTRLVPESIAIRAERPRVQYSAAITAMTPLKEAIQAWKIRLYGFAQCKVKVGVAGRDDLQTLQRVRRILGPKIDLRLDANEAWNWDELEKKLAPLIPFGITAVEQPVPHEQVGHLASVRRSLSVPIMLDESLCSLEDAYRAIEFGWCDLFNIRLSKCGGFLPSLRIAAIAHQAGLGYQLGCQVGETGLLSAAGRHFATSVSGIRYLEGSYDRHLVRQRLTRQDVTFGYGGWAPALPGPGLGVDVDRKALERCTVSQRRFRVA
ncbi:MAG: dipeptide epimerase [Planctomycetes bacterium]|nr:dipeptide epimerase [Planctomycetota bacterium]